MSTFLGLIEEIPGISVDRFDGENLKSSVYFLSHCHIDHMKGLSDEFFEQLDRCNKYLYCSSITIAFLQNKYRLKSSCVKDIRINTPVVVEYKLDTESTFLVTVTCVSAGHCPGSVMFLFEKNDLSVLYTGDFRINPIDFPKMKGLHYCQDKQLIPRTFTKIYLDTTFLHNDFPSFPSRQESITKMNTVIREWLDKDPGNVVILECSANYGSEFLFVELSKVLNMKIHVKSFVYDSYCCIAELSDHVTNDPFSTPIHACKNKISKEGLLCRQDVRERHIMTIIPSAMKWRKKDTSVVGEWDEIKNRTFNVCYSTHSSLEELRAFVQYFKALEIHPCVVKPDDKQTVYSLLDEITKSSNEQVTVEQTYNFELPKDTVFKKLPFKSQYFSSDDDSL
ncbi:DNA cross-link repair protein snm1 [Calliopsis andreniformis]|uniref:DNA cross-link repair protein snm1 n=1 Tax=Calliopsis andreniformis TaxID=337506 RepID=UPI003FCED206